MDAQTYTVKQVADLSGTSVRALHHYEALGLLAPARQPNGYRAYTSADLARLQQILLYRACGMELADIGRMLDSPTFDTRTALEQHLTTLLAHKKDLETLIATVRKTISSLEGATTMTDKERFEGLKRAAISANESTYGREARDRYGDATVDAANAKLEAMSEKEWNDMNELEEAIIEQLKAAIATGDPESDAARDLAAMHASWIRMHWGAGTYSPAAHRVLAQGYLADDRFRAYYDERAGEGATEFLVDALEANL